MSNLRKFQSSEINVSVDTRPLSPSDIVKAIQMGVRLAGQDADFSEKSILDRTLLPPYGNDNG